LGSRRLAIQDLSPAGHMPMATPDGRFHIAYNGEVYNAPLLREDLAARGHRFLSHSDTEVVLHLFQEYGTDALRRLNGMFALAVWDEARGELTVARDHFGIKPLYYLHQGGRFAFASEVKSILLLPGVERRLNVEALPQYLTFLWVPDPLTMFEGILKLPAGHYAVWRGGQVSVREYWDLQLPPAGEPAVGDTRALADELRERFTRTVRSQLVSDVPLGAFLSAGLDSSSIVAAMAGGGGPLRTYTIAFPAKYRVGEVTLDDTAVAARTAKHFGAQHTEILVEPDVVDLLPRLVWHMDEPVADPAVITAFLVSREARRTVTVLLSGVGGDELFAGYRKHAAHGIAARYQRLPGWARRGVLEPAVRALPSFRGTRLKGAVRLAKKMARSGSLPPEDRFLMDATYLDADERAHLCTPEVSRRVGHLDPWARHREWFSRVRHADFLNQMLYLDTRTFMVSLNLTYNDKMSMASSVEVRVPFLDWELAEWAAQRVAPSLKLHGSTTKFLLREAMRPVLPAEVLDQKKAGFGAPADYWLAHDLAPMLRDLLSPRRVAERGLFESAVVDAMIAEQASGRRDWSLQLWQLLTLELWQQVFVDGSDVRWPLPCGVPARA
jgi:asparagine synthase (glutamine-hydrolysing)